MTQIDRELTRKFCLAMSRAYAAASEDLDALDRMATMLGVSLDSKTIETFLVLEDTTPGTLVEMDLVAKFRSFKARSRRWKR